MSNCIVKYFKMKRLLKRYEMTGEKQIAIYRINRAMGFEFNFMNYHNHIIECEERCYNRLLKLKQKKYEKRRI